MGIVELIVLLLKLILTWLQHRTNPDVAYAKAVEEVTNEWKKNVDKFARKVATCDAGAVADMLREHERRRLQDALNRRED